MPSLPKWMADAMERLFQSQFHPVEVTHTELLDPALRRVRFEGDLGSTEFTPGQVIEFRVTEREFRHYTPALLDREAGVCEVIFYLHGKGPGSAWAAELSEGDRVQLMGPGGRMKLSSGSSHHFGFGDETSLGLSQCLSRAAQQHGATIDLVLELDAEHRHWPGLLGVRATATDKSPAQPGHGALEWLAQRSSEELETLAAADVYLTGRAQSIRQLHKALTERGVPKARIQTMAYWDDRKRGL